MACVVGFCGAKTTSGDSLVSLLSNLDTVRTVTALFRLIANTQFFY
jgi:hypothetical protein